MKEVVTNKELSSLIINMSLFIMALVLIGFILTWRNLTNIENLIKEQNKIENTIKN